MHDMDEGVMKTYARQPEVFTEGSGAILRTTDGREFLDLLAGIAVSALGHGHPRLQAELTDQLAKVAHLSNLFRHSYTEPVATRLCELAEMAALFFTNSGAESVECAMKLARRAMRRRGEDARSSFVAIEGGFHGRTLGALSLTHSARYREPFAPLQDVTWVAADDADALATVLRSRRHAALVLEPIQGEGGIRPLATGFLQAARDLCTETGTILVHDEIQSGCGRTGRFLAGQHAGVVPDIVTLAKPIAAGLPMGACLCTEELAATFDKGDHGSTFAGGPLVCRAAAVFLDELENGLQTNVEQRGEQFLQGLHALQEDLDIVREVRGRGLMLGLRLWHSGPQVQQSLYEQGVITNCTAGDVIRIVPPFVITAEQVDSALTQLREVLLSIQAPNEASQP
jgi:acetylornithine/N-succinyldiaminopimelate aminotransferase